LELKHATKGLYKRRLVTRTGIAPTPSLQLGN